ncbi:hypothetical protein [Haloquadratum walsbyi]
MPIPILNDRAFSSTLGKRTFSQHRGNGQESPYNIIRSSNIYEEQTHIIETDHMHVLLAILLNEEVFRSLSDNQQVFYDAVREVQPVTVEIPESNLEDIKQLFRDAMVTIVSASEIDFDYDAHRLRPEPTSESSFPNSSTRASRWHTADISPEIAGDTTTQILKSHITTERFLELLNQSPSLWICSDNGRWEICESWS